MREVKAKAGAPVWRTDESGKTFSLIITRAGRKAVDGNVGKGGDDHIRTAPGGSEEEQRVDDSTDVNGPRVGTKQSLVVRMLSAEQGDISPHTVSLMPDARTDGHSCKVFLRNTRSSVHAVNCPTHGAATRFEEENAVRVMPQTAVWGVRNIMFGVSSCQAAFIPSCFHPETSKIT